MNISDDLNKLIDNCSVIYDMEFFWNRIPNFTTNIQFNEYINNKNIIKDLIENDVKLFNDSFNYRILLGGINVEDMGHLECLLILGFNGEITLSFNIDKQKKEVKLRSLIRTKDMKLKKYLIELKH